MGRCWGIVGGVGRRGAVVETRPDLINRFTHSPHQAHRPAADHGTKADDSGGDVQQISPHGIAFINGGVQTLQGFITLVAELGAVIGLARLPQGGAALLDGGKRLRGITGDPGDIGQRPPGLSKAEYRFTPRFFIGAPWAGQRLMQFRLLH